MSFVPYGKRDGYLLKAIPAPLREALAAEARERDTSLTNIVGAALAARYWLEFEPSRRPLAGDFVGGASLGLRLPPAVMEAVRGEADKRSLAMRSVILLCLSERFGLEPPSLTKVNPDRRPGRPKHGRPRGRQKGARA